MMLASQSIKNRVLEEPTSVQGCANIETVRLVADWNTDLCVIRFAYDDTQIPRASLLVANNKSELRSLFDEQCHFLTNLNQYANTKAPVRGLKKYQFIQAGFGRQTKLDGGLFEGSLNKLQYRVIDFKEGNTGPFIMSDDNVDYQDIFVCQSDEDNTSLPGDFGGPVFAVEIGSSSPMLYLVGITLGSEFFEKDKAPEDADTVPIGHYNNVATSTNSFFENCFR
ncbi:hypothetical protein [Photobacterium lipolyticum]|uniref:Uncharacterized protein n=1 Tax=Photobacterium lipolyticum TaxID=266810 RepID=A0A2T3N1N3_9GAMM|nr:hypothetical protein [Photobacterium lipolyticum]PSW06181.1 hypothetical protein C9I89_06645 [Photobacterium lipolyticum]